MFVHPFPGSTHRLSRSPWGSHTWRGAGLLLRVVAGGILRSPSPRMAGLGNKKYLAAVSGNCWRESRMVGPVGMAVTHVAVTHVDP